jgi:hypothetical protein
MIIKIHIEEGIVKSFLGLYLVQPVHAHPGLVKSVYYCRYARFKALIEIKKRQGHLTLPFPPMVKTTV